MCTFKIDFHAQFRNSIDKYKKLVIILNMSSNIIFLDATLKETIWGGNRLKEFGYELPSNNVGECWAISAHPHGDNKIKNPEYKGMTLSQLWEKEPTLFGRTNVENKEVFPLLTKIIDAKADLSIQVHPDDLYAAKYENGSKGKTECWYILDCEANTKIVIGHNAKTKEEARSMIENARWSDFIREIPVHKGDFFFIKPGTIHAIKGGTLILETQQSSDITYRVYDYDRLNNGKPRELHIDKSLDVINCPFVDEKPQINPNKTQNTWLKQLVSCPLFTVWKADVKKEERLVQDQAFMLCSVIEGSGFADGIQITKGSNFILPYKYGSLKLEGNMELILSSI